MDWFDAAPHVPDPDEKRPEQLRFPPWWVEPDDEIPVLVTGGSVVGRTDHLAVALTAVRAHSCGFSVGLLVSARRLGLDRRGWNRYEAALFRSREHLLNVEDATGLRMRYGVQFADGRRAQAPEERGPVDFTVDPEVSLRANGGGTGGRDRITMRPSLWIWPLPPPGPVQLHIAVPGLDFADHVVDLDGAAITSAGQAVTSLWDANRR